MSSVLLLIHRWLGVAVGLLMVMWCLSGAVMMYAGYPALSEAQALRGLAPLSATACCRFDAAALPDGTGITAFRIEMMADTPVLHVEAESGWRGSFELRKGQPLPAFNWAVTGRIARGFAARSGIAGEPVAAYEVERDQWTVQESYARHRPLYRFRFDDAHHSDVYVSSRTGEVVLLTNAQQRFWNWLGAVPHWLYPSLLRENAPLWSQVVIWASLLGTFLTVTGLYTGFASISRAGAGRWSPYAGFSLWHHFAGLAAGVFLLGWIVSGLLSMNPWGLLESRGARAAVQKLQGAPLGAAGVQQFVENVAPALFDGEAVRLAAAPLGGELFVIAKSSGGEVQRFDAQGQRAPLDEAALSVAAKRLAGDARIRSAEMMESEDAYYYNRANLPVYRVVLDNPDHTRFYLDARTGVLALQVDAPGRWYRWLHRGLHSLDFGAVLRTRPLRDVLMLVLLAGATLVSVTGAYMALRSIARDSTGRVQ